MKLHRNESCPIHRSLVCCGREPAQRVRTLRLGVQRIEDPHHPRGYREMRSPAEMRKLLNRKIVEQNRISQSASKNSPITTMLSRIIRSRKGWEELGEMITRITSRQRTGGVMKKKDQPEWKTDGRLVGLRQRFHFKSWDINHLPTKRSPHEVPKEWCENGDLEALEDDRRDTFMSRYAALVPFHRGHWHEERPAHKSKSVH